MSDSDLKIVAEYRLWLFTKFPANSIFSVYVDLPKGFSYTGTMWKFSEPTVKHNIS